MSSTGFPYWAVPAGRYVPLPFAMTTSTIGRDQKRAWREIRHPEHELLWGASGEMSAYIDDVRWQIPPTVGMWIPAGTPRRITLGASTEARFTYFRPESFPHPWTKPAIIGIDDVVKTMLIHLHQRNMPTEARLRAESVVFDTLAPIEAADVAVPMPADPRALAVARRLIADPADQRGLADWAYVVGGSPRTLSRVFSQGTGMSFTEWRIQVRVRAAMSYLAAGVPVSTVSRRVGYETPSAFTSVFRKVTGRTPKNYYSDACELSA
ncbi:helix-turn-helix domain-containing protein [Rhodococcus erythropolis]|jgi:AraC-like DNA-binding protein|uniref:HTH-type transcriptional regulator RipA n=3 Tax=Rhodococcus erythropolis group TaxID=2840174 RepID=C0ZPS4_RHOE4|nr:MULTISPECIES: AraC family transcriptional regulator [Rhodococcus]MCD2154218.1 AraC family transcriptional regulator [Rhodococcus cerastii]NHE64428.1 helix-turn-helix transcriptional regulator [Rhodococcus sp. D-46]MBF7735359.1 helix-turn-helix domain-containing protein [Rhodococcus erythropolis]MBO8146529.1 helix-turn-helix transcriptional regulator [Rhodococcus erythropolis]MBQ7807168.1 helix-turn-helix domain-containing protein [Rhodococcus sp. (in: high G+C Gram-positive bacteria)]